MNQSEPRVIIQHGRDKPLRNQHPWVFSGAIREIEGHPQPGEIVAVRAHDGQFIGRGYFNVTSQIRVRILTWEDEEINEDWWRRSLLQAIVRRSTLLDGDGAVAYRLVNAENDFLPGLVVDRYGEWLVLQALTLGIDCRKEMIAGLLAELLPVRGIYERSDVDVRGKEGLKQFTGVLWGEEPPDEIEIDEIARILIDVRRGHKTGYYLDQAENRHLIFELVSTQFNDKCCVLNLFSYTGGFSLAAMNGGDVHAFNVDASSEALQLAERIAILNGYDEDNQDQTAEYIQADVFDFIRDQADLGEQYDIVVLDPPKFAHNKKQISSASRGYKDINLYALQLVKQGGYLLTFSCSGSITRDLFQKIVFGALVDSGRKAQIIRTLGAASDHPVALTFPEGDYLKGLLLRVF